MTVGAKMWGDFEACAIFFVRVRSSGAQLLSARHLLQKFSHENDITSDREIYPHSAAQHEKLFNFPANTVREDI